MYMNQTPPPAYHLPLPKADSTGDELFHLGLLYSTGQGGAPLDYVSAHMLFNLAAMRGSVAQMRAVQIIESGQWDGAAARLVLDTASQDDAAGAAVDFGSGFAAAKRGDLATARAIVTALGRRAAGRALEDRGYADIMAREIDALVALRGGDNDGAIASLRRAVAMEDSLPVDFGPPADVKPPRELLGEMLLQLGRPENACVRSDS